MATPRRSGSGYVRQGQSIGKLRSRDGKKDAPQMYSDMLIGLHCGHNLHFNYHPPRIGNWIWCARCGKERQVIAAQWEISAKCLSCSFVRRHGTDKEGAKMSATKHSNKQGHTVEVRQGGRVLAKTLPPARRNTALELLIDPPPF